MGDTECFLRNTNLWRYTAFRMGTHDWFYFFHNVFSCDKFTKTSEITLRSSEITVRGQKSELSVEENLSHHGMCKILQQFGSHGCRKTNFSSNLNFGQKIILIGLKITWQRATLQSSTTINVSTACQPDSTIPTLPPYPFWSREQPKSQMHRNSH